MSWFKRTPKAREPQRLIPRESSPLTEKLLKESRKAVRKKDIK
jgi:hypothetical protein